MKAEEAAKTLGISVRTLYRWWKRGYTDAEKGEWSREEVRRLKAKMRQE